uniref:Uncharacterized protein n=1 Tax=Rhizophora mucronata TaxID=61149 RepID=A0A2P2NG60_RHIMU
MIKRASESFKILTLI